jgi:hypothetical protein
LGRIESRIEIERFAFFYDNDTKQRFQEEIYMSKVISREDVHAYSEACSDMGLEFQNIAARLVKGQNRLKTFIDKEFVQVDPLAGQVALYMFTVCLRVFEQDGGKLKKVNGGDINTAFAKTQRAFKETLLPLDDDFSSRAKEVEWRSQSNLLDEILWALFDRSEEDKKQEEAPLDKKQSALIYLMLWTTVEALDAKYRPKK